MNLAIISEQTMKSLLRVLRRQLKEDEEELALTQEALQAEVDYYNTFSLAGKLHRYLDLIQPLSKAEIERVHLGNLEVTAATAYNEGLEQKSNGFLKMLGFQQPKSEAHPEQRLVNRFHQFVKDAVTSLQKEIGKEGVLINYQPVIYTGDLAEKVVVTSELFPNLPINFSIIMLVDPKVTHHAITHIRTKNEVLTRLTNLEPVFPVEGYLLDRSTRTAIEELKLNLVKG